VNENPNEAEVAEYLAEVRGALDDLPAASRAELLEDLGEHLREVAAEEGAGALRARLGEPAEYAAELRGAAGLGRRGQAESRLQDRFAATVRHGGEVAGRLDLRIGRAFGYARARDLLHALRPGWWVLRGWVTAQLLSGVHDSASWHGFVPHFGGNAVVGAVVTVALIALSVWLGRRTLDGPGWSRRLMLGASGLATVGAIALACWGVGSTNYVYADATASSYPTDAYGYSAGDITDVYVYDQAGNPVPQARLFDPYGYPIQMGDPVCQDGRDAPGTAADRAGDDAYGGLNGYDSGDGLVQPDDPIAPAWTYPLCPQDPGPFRAGPGAIGQPGPAATPTPGSTATPPATSTPTSTPKATPTSTPTGRHRTGTR
jgi:hypothetical protein